MEVTLSDIKVALILTFEDIVNPFGDSSMLYPKSEGYFKNGIIEDDYFIDINTKQIYPILFCDEEGYPCISPVFEIPYVYAIDSYKPTKTLEDENILKKATETKKWYQDLEELEKIGKVVSFEKMKIKYK